MCIVTKEVCTAIVDVSLPKYVWFPSGESLTEVVDGFKVKCGFPQCAGAVDGTHIPIVSPEEYPADYFNRKGWHSIVMQGTVNHVGEFVDIYVGWPGGVHDARVLILLILHSTRVRMVSCCRIGQRSLVAKRSPL